MSSWDSIKQGKTMSSTLCIWPILKALTLGAAWLNPDPSCYWQAVNQTQTTFLETYYAKTVELSVFNDKELRSWMSPDHNFLNGILKKENFSIQLEPMNPDEIGVVSILDVAVEWMHKGQKTTIKSNTSGATQEYPAVSMNKGFQVYSSMQHNEPIACVQTKNNDKVWMTVANTPRVGFEIENHISQIRSSISQDSSYDSLVFPMVDLDKEEDISWLKGMEWKKSGWTQGKITQALQQTKFKMNEMGARVKSAVAIVFTRECARRMTVMVIDKPFYLWIERPGLSKPIFAAHITPENWKDPKDLKL